MRGALTSDYVRVSVVNKELLTAATTKYTKGGAYV